ncbi:MFS transporter [Leucobacter sp. G161]|uniref:MFS transporter n=1 Tax=Leucobacter sp. G161 TaxID=663704 RepID=UPI00073C30CC|nr:MFS transporter [Leucobacter sp. G161]KUF06486.1 MFS transporter [Leucobacter sp. G161]
MSALTGARRRVGLAFAVAATMLLMVAASAPSPFYPQFAERLGLPPVATTLIFAIYAFTMLAALLTLGPLSDIVGRRPVVALGAALLALSMLLFWQATGLPLLLIARGVQGVAAGILLPAFSAMVVDFASPKRPDAASLWNTIGAMAGLGTGAISAATVLDRAANPAGVVFGTLAAVFLLVALAVLMIPGSAAAGGPAGAGAPAARLAIPRLRVPASLRRPLLIAVPAIIAGWATNGLFLALGSSVVQQQFGAVGYAQQTAAIPIFAGSGILASVLLHRRSARVVSVYGTGALALGTMLSLLALRVDSLGGYLVAASVTGTGFGTAFMGVLKTLMPRIDPAERAQVMAVIYVVSYLAFGVPTIVAGLLVPVISLRGTMQLLGLVIVVLGVAATLLRLRADGPRDRGGVS